MAASTASSIGSLYADKKTSVYVRGTVQRRHLCNLLNDVSHTSPPHLKRVKFVSLDTEMSVTYGTYNVHGDLKGKQPSRHILYRRVVEYIDLCKADILPEDVDAARALETNLTHAPRSVGASLRDIYFYSEESNPTTKARTIYDAYIEDDTETECMLIDSMKFQERKAWQTSGIKVELMDHFYLSILNPRNEENDRDDVLIVELSSSSFTFTPSRLKGKLDAIKALSKSFIQVDWID